LSGAGSEVKKRPRRSGGRGFFRHRGLISRGSFEGWQVGAVVVGAALLGALLAVPQPVEPDVMPLPRVDWREVSRARERDELRARQAADSQLPYEVRSVGEVFRAFGRANAGAQESFDGTAIDTLPALARDARAKHGDEALLTLESTQSELFVDALARWEKGEDTTNEIAELGGNFLTKAKTSGWLSGDRSLRMALHERRAMFRVRWAEILGLRSEGVFAPTANEWRIYYRFLLEHSPGAMDQGLKIVAAVEKLDPDYPGVFARGVLYYRLGQFAKSAEAFRGHLTRHPDGPWKLRAQNHLAAATLRAKEPDE